MNTYYITPQNRAKLIKRWTMIVGSIYIVFAMVFGVLILSKNSQASGKVSFMFLLLLVGAAYFSNRKKYITKTEKTCLLISKTEIKLQVFAARDITMVFADAGKVTTTKEGINLASKSNPRNTLFVMNNFEKFAEIEKLINKAVSQNNLQPVS